MWYNILVIKRKKTLKNWKGNVKMTGIRKVAFDIENQKVMFHTENGRVYSYSVKENAMYGIKGKIVTNPFNKIKNPFCEFPQNCPDSLKTQLTNIARRIILAKRYDKEIIDKLWNYDLSTKFIKNRNILYIDNGFLGIITYDFNTKKFGIADTVPNNDWKEFPYFMRGIPDNFILEECLFTYMEQLTNLYTDNNVELYEISVTDGTLNVPYITYCINNNLFPFLYTSYKNYITECAFKKIEQRYKKNDEKTIRLMFEKGNLLGNSIITTLKEEIVNDKWEKIDFLLQKIVPIYKSTVAKFIVPSKLFTDYFQRLYVYRDYLDTLATFSENDDIMKQSENKVLSEKMKENQSRLSAITQDEYKNCCIVLPQSKKDLAKESESNHNCVGRFNSYYENCAYGLIFLVFIRKTDNRDDSYITCEFDIAGGRFVQTLGFANRDLCRDEREIVKHYETKIQEILRGE